MDNKLTSLPQRIARQRKARKMKALGMSYADIGREFGITRARARAIVINDLRPRILKAGKS